MRTIKHLHIIAQVLAALRWLIFSFFSILSILLVTILVSHTDYSLLLHEITNFYEIGNLASPSYILSSKIEPRGCKNTKLHCCKTTELKYCYIFTNIDE